MAFVTVQVIGAKDVERALKGAKNGVDRVKNEMQEPLADLIRIWKNNMPSLTGSMKNSVIGVVQGPGSAQAFTQTFLTRTGGYATFPEQGGQTPQLSNDPRIRRRQLAAIRFKNLPRVGGYQRPGFSKRTANEFANKWLKDSTDKITREAQK